MIDERIAFIDIAKGLGIFLVVLGHCIGGISFSHCCGVGTYAHDVAYLIYTFHMPAFFFMSGILVGRSPGRTSARLSLLRIGTRLVYPYLLWSTIQTSLAIFADTAVNRSRSSGDLLGVIYDAPDQFWFLYTLIFIRIFDQFIFTSLARYQIAIFIAFDLILYGLLFWNSSDPNLLNNFLYGASFYLLGRMFTTTMIRQIPPIFAIVALLGLITFAALGEAYGINHRSLLPAALAGIAFLLLFANQLEQQQGVFALVLSCMGRYSMAIYLVHVIASGAVRFMLLWAFHSVNYWTAVATTTMAGIAIPLVIAIWAKRLGLSAYLGFGGGSTHS